ncbi:MAG: peptide-methionine (S)-S-oxide reductase [Bacteroidota bacterium]
MDTKTIYLGAGCYWSKEYHLSRLVGVLGTEVGFAGGQLENPSYLEVCGKKTGHAEVVAVRYQPKLLSFYCLLQHFFQLHPAQVDRRKNGGQYRSAIFFPNIANKLEISTINWMFGFLTSAGLSPTTEVKESVSFFRAMDRHQGYCERLSRPPKNGLGFPLYSWPAAPSGLIL